MRTKLYTALLIVLLLAGCSAAKDDPDVASAGGSAQPRPTSTLSRFDQFVRYAQCMREQGVPMSDPQQDGDVVRRPRAEAGQDKGKVEAANEVCKALAPPQETGPQMQQKIELVRQFARCMREHGVENYPDPGPDGLTRVPEEIGNDPQNPDAQDFCKAEIDRIAASLRPSP